MKMTLLEMVQDILNDMDGDEVNSIDDTFESQQVAQIIKTSYYELISGRNWPHTKESLQLEPSGDTSYPTHMSVKEEVKELCFINYNKSKLGQTKKDYKKTTWLEPDDFLRVLNNRNSDSDTVDIIQDYTGVELLIINNKAPTYYTSFDDKNIVFDSYDNEVDSALQKSKTQCQAYVIPSWTAQDDFIPDMPSEAFSGFLEEAKSTAMFKLKQITDSKAEQKASRQQRWLARKDWTINGGVKTPNYGRRRR